MHTANNSRTSEKIELEEEIGKLKNWERIHILQVSSIVILVENIGWS